MRTVYQIKDVYGETIAEHVRVTFPDGKKRMYWQVPGMPDSGLYGLSTPDLPLFGSEHVGRWSSGQTVLITEGEPAMLALRSLGIHALGTVTGAGATPGEDALAILLPFDVVLWPDHDDDGEKHMARVAATLLRLGGRARRLTWAGARDKGDDAADFLTRGGTRVTLELMIGAATPWQIVVEQPVRPARPVYDAFDTQGRVEQARSHLAHVALEKLGSPLKQDRRSLWWRCPFHQDRSPSFKVDLIEPYYVCFGCGARGDVFTFLRAMEGLAFKDAIRTLAPPMALGGIPRLGA